MVKQLPKLTLVGKEEGGSSTDGSRAGSPFELLSLEQIPAADRERLQAFTAEIVSGSTLVSAAQGVRSWDLRPVVIRPGENDPSIVRFVGPAVSRASHLSARLRESFDRIIATTELTPSVQDWGIHEGQIWYRRPLVEQTLAHLLADKQPLDERRVLSIVRAIIEEVCRWHDRGIVHGHISSSNIFIDPFGRVSLLDAGIGIALVQAGDTAGETQHQSFAPELINGQAVVFSADLYGLGLVMRRIFVVLAQRYQGERTFDQIEASLKPFSDLGARLLEVDPGKRPGISNFRRLFSEACSALDGSKKGTRVPTGNKGIKSSPLVFNDSFNPAAPSDQSTSELAREILKNPIPVSTLENEPTGLLEKGVSTSSRDDRAVDRAVGGKVQSDFQRDVQRDTLDQQRGIDRFNSGTTPPQPPAAVPDNDNISASASTLAPREGAVATPQQVSTVTPVAWSTDSSPSQTAPTQTAPGQPFQPGQSPPSAAPQAAQFHPQHQPDPGGYYQYPPGYQPQGYPPNYQPGYPPGYSPAPGYPPQGVGAPGAAPYGVPPGQYPPQVYGGHPLPPQGHQHGHPHGHLPGSVYPHQPMPPGQVYPVNPYIAAQNPPSGSFPIYQQGGVNGSPPQASQAPQASKSGGAFWIFIFLASLALAALWYVRTGGLPFEPSVSGLQRSGEFRESWNSRIPSRMLTVALAAIDKEKPSVEAESIILASSRGGESTVTGVNAGLIAVAFSDQWEQQLSPEDRRIALALGLGGLLKESLPQDLPPLKGRHPGVVLAVAASVNAASGKALLANISAEVLADLPPPYGDGFRTLIQDQPNITCGDEGVLRLARLGTKGIELDELVLFLKDDTARRLQALASILAQDAARSKIVLELLVQGERVAFAEPAIAWGRAFKLNEWDAMSANDRLFILAGVPRSNGLTPEYIEKLCAFPHPKLRAFALERATSGIKFEHPGAVEAIHALAQKPEVLSAEQTVLLLKLLMDPAKLSTEMISKWLETNPNSSFAAGLLLSTAGESSSTDLDMSLAVFLKGKGWKPQLAQLRKLSGHPNKFTRLFAYSEIYLLEDRETAKELLQISNQKETDPENRAQLEQMLAVFGG